MANDESITSVEIWKPVVGWESLYSVSSAGRIRRDAGRTASLCLSARTTDRGYSTVMLCKPGMRTSNRVHRLVAAAFIPNPRDVRCVNHKNGIKTDNRLENLEWCTHKENEQHSRDVLGRDRRGENGPSAKLIEIDVRTIRRMLASGSSQTKAAKMFGVSESTISSIALRKTWTCAP